MQTPTTGPDSRPQQALGPLQPRPPKGAPVHEPGDEPVAYYHATTFQDMLDALPHDKAAMVRQMVDDFIEKFKASKTFWRFNPPQRS